MIDISKLLKAQGIRLKAVNEELIDHFSSQFEKLIENGQSESSAIEIVIEEIQQTDLIEIQKKYFSLHYKNYIIMSFTLVLASLFIIFQTQELNEPPSLYPIDSEELSISSGFGMRMHPINKQKKHHRGIDIIGKIGTPVVATSSGVITDCGYHEKNGFYIEIKHDNIYTTRYHHLSKVEVEKNQKVALGNKIGEIGSSGFSTGPHLHYEVIENGKPVDPSKFLKV